MQFSSPFLFDAIEQLNPSFCNILYLVFVNVIMRIVA